ncbi:sulfatase-like hydrolase/transferase [Sinomonas sp. JGH33]|uniref:Sulfatase-like hydrolase/transferase n=1 Tax=Sinomonas terricola TaxID=3110330 RepID=A0ABU5T7Y1_9MICC|nr:sulfatase-like hydrolase/transferase [Sinomonas sp. JGH33]MEA5455624.1 sulfatase-like hydrolase/transferase [Sinomonas sp. JGH33]
MRLNVLWIMSDELRADAISAYGNSHPEIQTPNIDRLAQAGVLFESSYTASPVCVPARTSLMTGRGPDETGVWGNEAYGDGAHPMAPDLVTFPEVLAAAGWTTRDFGKEHLPPGISPWQSQDPAGSSMRELVQGARETGEKIVRTPGLGFPVAGTWPAGKDYPPEAITQRAIAAMAESEGPFLVRASYLQPHTPVIVPEPWASRYEHVDFADAPVFTEGTSRFESRFAEVNAGHAMDAGEFQRAQVAYHGAVAWLDDQVGRLLDALELHGMADRTVVVLTSDHGAHLGEDGAFGKHTFAPQSHRVPLIVVDPRRAQPGSRRSDLAHGTDLARTVLGSCRVPAPRQIGGRDLLADPAPDMIISAIGYGAAESRAFPNRGMGTGHDGGGWPQRFCVRTRRYRLDMTTRVDGRRARPGESDVFLADSCVDPLERINYADDPRYRPVRERLEAAVRERAERAFQPEDDAVYRAFTPPAAG